MNLMKENEYLQKRLSLYERGYWFYIIDYEIQLVLRFLFAIWIL